MASGLKQSRSRQISSSTIRSRNVNSRKPQVISGVMPWQLQAEMDRRSNPQEDSLNRSSRNKNRYTRSAAGSANSASQLQQRLIGGMNLSMALPRSRPDRTNMTNSSNFQQNGTWSCSVCGSSNNIRDGDSCECCFQNALISSSNTVSRNSSGGEQSFSMPIGRRSLPQHPVLSAEQWSDLENKAAHRQNDGDSEPCPICLEDFKRGVPQVLLSCSHIFHTTCLRNFESFQGRDPAKEKPACPVCRAVDYEQRSTELGGMAHINAMAVRIQSLARGVASRIRYAKIVRAWINSGGGDEKRRREYVVQEFLVDQVEDDSLDALLSASDEAIALSQLVFTGAGDTMAHSHYFPSNRSSISESTWYSVLMDARNRCDNECAICMNNFVLKSMSSSSFHRGRGDNDLTTYGATVDTFEEELHSASSSTREVMKTRVLLSCSHIFHDACLSAFERFNLTSSTTTAVSGVSLKPSVCPMCRATYEKRKLSNYGFTFVDALEEE